MPKTVSHNVLIATVENATTRTTLKVLAEMGIRGAIVASMDLAMKKADSSDWDLIMVDLDLGHSDALELLRRVKRDRPELPVLVISQDVSVEQIVSFTRAGCADFLVKPLDPKALKALFRTFLPNHDVPFAAQPGVSMPYQIVGRSPRFRQTIKLAKKVAPTLVPVLITGESGTGKELISYLIHQKSNRSSGPYVLVNCAALSESLLESELFGHERGAFTGAYRQRKGRFEMAHGGTLLLDEISETSPKLQAELLRVLEQQDFERVGGSHSIKVNVRTICTSNRNLAEEVEKGAFRTDLYYRINGVNLAIPPLRKRKEDIVVLAWHFVNVYAGEVRRLITDLDQEMLETFDRYSWPGNVRQLRNVIRTALILGQGPTLSLEGVMDLKEELRSPAEHQSSTLRLQDLERRAILEALCRTEKNRTKAARLLGITDRTLREKLRKYRQQGVLQTAGESRW